ncbi:MAG: MurR/RpiR family transcriptional regulator [Tissierellia bacterium]|nr:MurR/RpiR family transcriptional regulator [Tissierellia bacterium]
MNILLRIQQNYNNLTKKEKYVADYILKEKSYIDNISISSLAKKTEVSVGTITKVSKKLGYDNFVDMKLAIAKTDRGNRDIDNDNFAIVYEFYKEIVERANEILSVEVLQDLLKEINSHRTVHVYGIGSSGLSAMEFQYRLMRLGYQVQSKNEYHQMIINSNCLNSDDLVIAISVNGQTHEIVEAVELAKLREAYTIAITSAEDSPLAKTCDYFIPIINAEFIKEHEFINSQFSILYLLDIICKFLLEDEVRYENFNKTVKYIKKKYKY